MADRYPEYFGERRWDEQVPVFLVDLANSVCMELGKATPRTPGIIRLYVDVIELEDAAIVFERNCDQIAEYYKVRGDLPDLKTPFGGVANVMPFSHVRNSPVDPGETHAWVPRTKMGEAGAPRSVHASKEPDMASLYEKTMRLDDRDRLNAVVIMALMNMLGGGKITLDPHDLRVAQQKLDSDCIEIHQYMDPVRIVIKVKET